MYLLKQSVKFSFLILTLTVFVFFIQDIDAVDSNTANYLSPQSPTLSKLLPVTSENSKDSASTFTENNASYLNLINQNIDKLSISFIQNMDHVDPAIKFYANTFVGNVYVTDYGITYVLESDKSKKKYVIKEIFSDKQMQIQGIQGHPTIINYIKGSQDEWKTNMPTFAALKTIEAWPGIDVHLQAYGNNLEKTFNVKPGSNVEDIVVTVDGISNLQIKNEKIVLHGHSKFSKLIEFSKPKSFQIIDGKKQFVSVQFVKYSSNQYGFEVGSYNTNYELFIDPLISSTYLGGESRDKAHDVALDGDGNVYVVGETFDLGSIPFPVTVGALNETNNGATDVFISKFSPDLSQLLASTFFGGTGTDIGTAIDLDNSGLVYITGETKETGSNESNLPTTIGAYDVTHNGGSGKKDVFVSKFSPDLSSLMASTFIGGGNDEESFDILVNGTNDVYIVGKTDDAPIDFPVTSCTVDCINNDEDGFVARFNTDLTQLLSSTYLGNDASDSVKGIALDSSFNVIVIGETLTNENVDNFPTTSGAYSEDIVGSWDIFVSKLNPNLTQFINSTLIGGVSEDRAGDIAVAPSGSIYITGSTQNSTTDYPTTFGAWDEIGNGKDIFVSKLSSTLSNLEASTLLGGDESSELGVTLDVDTSGNIFVGGRGSSDFPTTTDAFKETGSGSVISKFNADLSDLLASTFFPLGNSNAFVSSLVFDIFGNVVFVGESFDSGSAIDLPSGGFNSTHSGNFDAYVAKLTSDLSDLCSPPDFGDWIITHDCTISSDIITPASVMIQNNSVVTVNSGSLTIPSGQNIIIVKNSGLLLKSGAILNVLS